MPIIFNTVETFVETIGQQKSIRPYNTLDSFTSIFTGPTEQAGNWIPKPGSKHPTYGNMFASGNELVTEAAGITVLRTTFVGKLYDMGQPSVGSSTHQGEISWTSYDSLNVYVDPQNPGAQAGGPSGTQTTTPTSGVLIPAVAPIYLFEFVSYTWLCRFIVTTAVYKSITRNPPEYIGGGGGSVRVTSQFQTGRVSATSGSGLVRSSVTFPNVLIDSSKNPLNNGWFEITSTWGPQPEVVTTLVNEASPTNLNAPQWVIGQPLPFF